MPKENKDGKPDSSANNPENRQQSAIANGSDDDEESDMSTLCYAIYLTIIYQTPLFYKNECRFRECYKSVNMSKYVRNDALLGFAYCWIVTSMCIFRHP